MVWKAAIVREPAASRGSSTGRTKAGQMAARTAHARWERHTRVSVRECVRVSLLECLSILCESPTSSVCYSELVLASALFSGM